MGSIMHTGSHCGLKEFVIAYKGGSFDKGLDCLPCLFKLQFLFMSLLFSCVLSCLNRSVFVLRCSLGCFVFDKCHFCFTVTVSLVSC